MVHLGIYVHLDSFQGLSLFGVITCHMIHIILPLSPTREDMGKKTPVVVLQTKSMAKGLVMSHKS